MEWMNKTSVFLCGVGGAVMTGLFKDEIVAWLPRFTSWTINLAAKRMPPETREQSREEWLAHVAEYPGNITPLFQAISIFVGCTKDKTWTVSRTFRYIIGGVFFFQVLNFYILIHRTVEQFNSGYYEEHFYTKAFFSILSFAVIIFCLKVNVRDIRLMHFKEVNGLNGEEVSLREAAIVMRWAAVEAIKKKFRR